MKLKAVLFDLDGVLRDSREVIYPALEHSLKFHTGTTPTRKQLTPHVHHEDEVHKAFAPNIPHDEFVATYLAKVKELRPQTKLYDGAQETLQQLKDSGYVLGIVSHATTALDFLSRHDLTNLFTVILGIADMKERKPSPAPVLQAIDALQVSSHDAIMIGDLPTDIQSSVGAHLRASVGITQGFGDERSLRLAGATHIIHSLAEVARVIKEIEEE